MKGKKAMMKAMNKKYFKSNSAGFTLLELLVVISIIGILVAMGAVAYSTAQKTGRDARRQSDMKALQSAQEQYYADNASVYANNQSALAPNYLSAQVAEMKSGWTAYSMNTTGVAPNITAYCACARLEKAGGGNASGPGAGGVCAFGTGNYFCVKNLQ